MSLLEIECFLRVDFLTLSQLENIKRDSRVGMADSIRPLELCRHVRNRRKRAALQHLQRCRSRACARNSRRRYFIFLVCMHGLWFHEKKWGVRVWGTWSAEHEVLKRWVGFTRNVQSLWGRVHQVSLSKKTKNCASYKQRSLLLAGSTNWKRKAFRCVLMNNPCGEPSFPRLWGSPSYIWTTYVRRGWCGNTYMPLQRVLTI